MVLINGVKYACERCIRGHRVTTCTHTDQPLMMIKPKGRPSTLCEHCKNARKSKNQHQKCTCQHKLPGQPHESGCACKDDDSCQCQKTSHRRKATSLKKQNSIKKKPQLSQPTPPSQSSQLLLDPSDISLFQRSTLHFLDGVPSRSATPQLSAADLHLLDMSLSDDSLSSDYRVQLHQLRPLERTSSSDYISELANGIGMEYLNDFKPSPLVSSRLGEVTVPLDEYVQPMQQMNDNLNDLLKPESDAKSGLAAVGAANGKASSSNNFYRTPVSEDLRPEQFLSDIPVPFVGGNGVGAVPGNGLLDLFDPETNLIGTNGTATGASDANGSGSNLKYSPGMKFRSKSPPLADLSSPNGNPIFALSQIVGSVPSSLASISSSASIDSPTQSQPLSHSHSVSHSHSQSLTQIQPHQSSHLHHQYHQVPPHHSSGPSHHHYSSSSHFSPYPAPNRSESFLSIASSTLSDYSRPPVNQSTDSLTSLHQLQTLTNNNNNNNNGLGNTSVKNETENESHSVSMVPNFSSSSFGSSSNRFKADSNSNSNLDLFNGNTLHSFLDKIDFNP